MNKLDPEARTRIVAALVEGVSINSIVRMTGIAKTTVLRLVREIGRQTPLASFTTGEIMPGPDYLSNAAIDAHIRATAITVHHPLGTCKMARASDPAAVVDPELKVLGIDGRRVVDASVMPDLIGGNINAAVIMIAEKAADLIRGRPPLAPVNI